MAAGEAMLPRSGPPRTFTHPFVHLVPSAGSWTARWGDDGEVGLYCDVTTPPVIRSDTVTAVDLDLDVVRYHDGRVAIIDQDQFARRRTQMAYPPRVVTDAVVTASRLYAAVASGHEPFATVGADVLAHHTPVTPHPSDRSASGPHRLRPQDGAHLRPVAVDRQDEVRTQPRREAARVGVEPSTATGNAPKSS